MLNLNSSQTKNSSKVRLHHPPFFSFLFSLQILPSSWLHSFSQFSLIFSYHHSSLSSKPITFKSPFFFFNSSLSAMTVVNRGEARRRRRRHHREARRRRTKKKKKKEWNWGFLVLILGKWSVKNEEEEMKLGIFGVNFDLGYYNQWNEIGDF